MSTPDQFKKIREDLPYGFAKIIITRCEKNHKLRILDEKVIYNALQKGTNNVDLESEILELAIETKNKKQEVKAKWAAYENSDKPS